MLQVVMPLHNYCMLSVICVFDMWCLSSAGQAMLDGITASFINAFFVRPFADYLHADLMPLQLPALHCTCARNICIYMLHIVLLTSPPAGRAQTAFPIGVFSILDRPFKDLKTYMRFPKVRGTIACLNVSLDDGRDCSVPISVQSWSCLPSLPPTGKEKPPSIIDLQAPGADQHHHIF